jgi:hypothetical protein
MGTPDPAPIDRPSAIDRPPAVERRWRAVLLRAAGIVLLCHAVPAAGVGIVWLGPFPHDYAANCTECGAFDGIIAIALTALVAGSLGIGLILAAILVAARMRNPVRVGLVAGVTGIFLTIGALDAAVTSLVNT